MQEDSVDLLAWLRNNPLPAEAYPDDYREYLASPLWRRIRRRILKRDGKTCQRCGGSGSEVHHRSYDDDVLDGRNDEQLATVCDGCHNVITFDDAGKRRTPAEADAVLFDKNCPTDFPEPKVDLRTGILRPANWSRMTSVQRRGFLQRYLILRREKKSARTKKFPPKPATPGVSGLKPWG